MTILTLLCANTAWAAPYEGLSVEYRQPDGTPLNITLWGDEYFAYQETEDGYLVLRDPKTQQFCYARVSADGGDLISTGVPAGQPIPKGVVKGARLAPGAVFNKSTAMRGLLGVDAKGRSLLTEFGRDSYGRVPAIPQTIGVRVGLVLLAEFPDRPQDVTITRSQVDDYCNDEDYSEFGNATSIYGYFKIQSDGKLEYNCVVTAYFTAANNRDYYTDNSIGFGTRARELIREGLDVLDAEGFDFNTCDADGNSVIDGVNIFYAGARVNAWSEGLWPHKSSTSWSGFTGHGLSTSFQYQITDMSTSLTIGTFCHENGHMLCGFPDLYSYDGNAARISSYSLMASSGSTHPVKVDPYLKIHAGWADVVDLNAASHQLCGLQEDNNYFYRFRNPVDSEEYLLFEVRSNTGYEGPYGGAAGSVNPSTGVVVYHADENGRNTYSSIFTTNSPGADYSTPYELMVVEANPASATTPWYDDPTPNANDALHSGDVDELDDTTTPALKFWTASGRSSNAYLHVHSVSAQGATMSFIAGTGALSGPPTIGLTTTALEPSTPFGSNAVSQSFGVFNSSGGTLSYTVSDDVAWLSVAPPSGTADAETDTLTVTYSTDALASGVYTGVVSVADGAASNSPQTFEVRLTVEHEPLITLSTNAFDVTLAPGTGTNQYIDISNDGGGTLLYALSESVYWLSLDSSNGTVSAGSDRLTLSFSDRVPSGTYNTSITVSSANGTNSPQTISVALTVTGSVNLFLESPDGGETLYTGAATDITWNAAPSVTGNMQIDLLQGGSVLTNIVASTANDGLYSWSVPAGLGGDTFRIRITNLDVGSTTDDSDADFTILTALINDPLDTDPGYTITSAGSGSWEYGIPQPANGNSGPTTAYTGSKIYDTDLDYAVFGNTELTTPSIDCSNYTNLTLSFAGQFSVFTGFSAAVQISTNGISWSNLYYQAGVNYESSWSLHSYDITAAAAHQSSVYLRWAHLATPGGVNYSGMAIDDVRVVGTYSAPPPPAPPAPVATAASSLSSIGFTANWNATSGALGYELDVWQIDEDFSDGDSTSFPSWSGDTAAFEILTDGTLPNGNAASDGSFLASKSSVADSLLVTPSTEVSEWRFSLGTPDVDPSDNNYFGVVLMSDSAISGDIASANFQGYYLRIGNNSSPDQIRLYRSTGVGKVLEGTFSSSDFATGGLRDGINVRVTRSGAGVWQVWTSTGFAYANEPANDCGTVTQNSYNSSLYFGVYKHISSASSSRRIYIDNIEIGTRNYVSGFESLGVAGTSQAVTGLGALTDYAYMLRSTNATATSTNSNIIAAQTHVAEVIATPATNLHSTGFHANWSAVSGALGYLLDVLQVNEDFDDGDFTSSPVWQGDTGSYDVLTDSTLPNGNALTDGRFLASRDSAADSSLLVPSTETAEWVFSLASPDLDPSSANHFGAVLMANSPFSGDLAAANFQGYYLRIGDAGTDQIALYRKPGASSGVLVGTFNTPSFSTGGLRDGLNIRVTRDTDGAFELFYATGFSMTNLPAASAGKLTNNAYSASSYCGVYGHFSSADASRRVYMDNVFFGSSANYAGGYENAAAAGITEAVSGLNVFADYYYRVRAQLPGGTSEESNWIYTRTLLETPTALAASGISSNQFTANWTALNGASEYRLDVLEMADDFSDGEASADPVWSGDTASFEVLSDVTVPNGNAGTDGSFLASKSSAVDSLLRMPSTETREWRFSLGTPDIDPSDNNYFGVVLMSDSAISGDVAGASFQGYYLRVGNNSSPDQIRFYRSTGAGKVLEGTFSSPDFASGGLRDGINVKVTRDANGVWELWTSSGFTFGAEPTTYAGAITQNTYSVSSWFGVYKHISSASTSRRVYIDNIAFSDALAGYDNRSVAGTSETLTGLPPETSYLYRVRGVFPNGSSEDSNVIVVSTTAYIPPGSIRPGTMYLMK